MLTCIARTKKLGDDSPSHHDDSDPNNNAKNYQPVKSITSQIKDMALKASGAYKNCGRCTGPSGLGERNKGESLSSELESERFRRLYRRNGSGSSCRRTWGKELEERLKGISSGEGTPSSDGGGGSGRRVAVVVEEEEGKEWVAQVETGVLISFVSLPGGGNHLKRVRFSGEIFNKWQAQRWWTENFDKVMELYNVQRVNHQAFPLPTPPRSEEDESSKHESVEDIPVTPPLTKDRLAMGYSSSDSFDVQSMESRHHNDVHSTPKLSTISAAKTEISSMDASITTCSSTEADYSQDLSISTMDTEWVEEDEPGVYITIKPITGGKREIARVRFSREKFGEVHARLWWEENRARIHEQYL
ncbi:hypothetical protein Lal_00010976 [Lupinus albus]|uniref:Putative brevis radix (BRX) domain, transcription factor BREVIS RADIX domain-containing protein n=1 Tax=Lupinus albus TaxID=3870 RepID=A0A6A4PTA3_LUPAL|nr:putative brevis radix (BRX) domain, transcription factor BREVIS RADIX domain-containing protein [Lupinus albus]KAF1892510.1 hypothetical protein Lal_00010976 [Lupinus albus]